MTNRPGAARPGTAAQAEDTSGLSRYKTSVPVAYRRAGDEAGAWREGRTVDVGPTGILFETSTPALPVATPIEFIFTVDERWLRICRGHGRIVWCRERPGGMALVATTIDAHTISRSADGVTT